MIDASQRTATLLAWLLSIAASASAQAPAQQPTQPAQPTQPTQPASSTAVQSATPEAKAEALSAYEAGKAHYMQAAYGAALSAFQRSDAAFASPNTKLMIARCLVQLGRTEDAHATYDQVIADAAAEPHYAPAGETARTEKAQLPPTAAEAAAAAAPAASAEPMPADEPIDDGAPPDNPLEQRAKLGPVIGGKIGAGIGAPVSEFGGSYVLELELGWALPLPAPVDHSLQVFLSGQYSQPETDGSQAEPDSRLPGDGVMTYALTQQQLALTLGALYRIPVGSDLLMPYGGAGARMYLLRTRTNGEAGGEVFGENQEDQTDIGLVVMGGLEIFVGPGAVLGELSFAWASVDGFVLRETAVGGLAFSAGYRLIL